MEADEQEGDFQEFAEGAAGVSNQLRGPEPHQASGSHQGDEGAKTVVANRRERHPRQRGGCQQQTAQLSWPSSAVTRRANPDLDQGDNIVEAEVPTGE
jgi:hypothetical protein